MKKPRSEQKNNLTSILWILFLALIILGLGGWGIWNRFFTEPPELDVQGHNLLANGSFEKSDENGRPTDWILDASGPDLKQSHAEGYIGDKSLKIEISNYTNGLVSLESPVTEVKSGQNYFFKIFYITNLEIDVSTRYHYKDGTSQLVWAKYYPVADQNWSTLSTVIQPPEGIDSVSVVINFVGNGYANLDGAYLIRTNDLDLPDHHEVNNILIPNPSLENSPDGLGPADWTTYRAGDNLTNFTYAGDQTNHYLRSEISDYTNGEAKWQYLPVPAIPFQYLYFKVDYRSNTTVNVIAEYSMTDGTRKFYQVAKLLPTRDWTSYTTRFESFPGAKDMFVSLVLHSNGYVESDNYSLTDITEGAKVFDRPLVSVTFDDGWESSYTNGIEALNQHGFPATFYINPSLIDQKAYMAKAQVQDLLSRNHQIASHGNAHNDMSLINPTLVEQSLRTAYDYLRTELGVETADFAFPYGKHDAQADYLMKKLYASHRGTDSGINTKQNFNPYDLKVLFVNRQTTPTLVKEYIRQAKEYKGWLIIVYHRIEDGNSNNMIPVEQLRAELEIIQESEIPVVTIRQGLEELEAQVGQ